MSKHVRILLLLAALWVPWATQSQVTSATFATGVDATRWITLSANATTLTFGDDDEGVSTVQNIGFPFYFGQSSYSQFSCNTNGAMRLGSEVISTRRSLSSSNDLPKILPFGKDLSIRSNNGQYIKYELTGTAPNRILVVETRQANTYYSTATDVVTYQVQLYEGTSKLVLLYGSNTGTTSSIIIGMATSATDKLSINPSTHTTSTSTSTVSTWPGDGRYYEFTPVLPTCLPPAWAAGNVITHNSATLNWTGAASSYVLEYSTEDFTPGTAAGTMVNATGSSYTLTGLLPNTTYYAYLHGDCGNGDTSLNVSTTFTTECAPVAAADMPYLDDFSAYSSTTNLPFCWKRGSASTTYPNVYGYTVGGRSHPLYFYASSYSNSSCMAILPRMEMSANSLELVFDGYRSSYSYSGNLVVGVMTDPLDDATFVPVDTVTVNNTSMWVELEADLTSYTGTGRYIALRYDREDYSNGSFYVSNLQVLRRSSCRKPTVAYATNVTYESAQVNIHDGDNTDANSYMLYYGTTNDRTAVTDSVSFTGLSTTLSNLEYLTTYYGWVRVQCSEENSRERAFTFTTLPPCALVNDLTCSVNAANGTAVLSWSAPTEGIAATGYEVSYKASDANEWTTNTTTANYYQITGLTVGSSYEYNVVSQCGTYNSADNSGSFVLAECNTIAQGNTTNNSVPFQGYYNYSYTQSIYTSAELATMGDTISGIHLTNTNTSTSFTFTLDVYMGNTDVNSFASITDWIDGDDLTLVASAVSVTVSGAGQVYIPFTTPFVRNHAKNIVVAIDNNTGDYSFRYPTWSHTATATNRSIYIYEDSPNYDPMNVSSSGYSAVVNSVPDITFNASCNTPSCAAPLLICTGKTTNSLDLRWFAGLDETSWTIDYRRLGDSLWTNFLSATTLTGSTLTGLATGENYEVRVKNSCSTDSTFLVIKELSTECGPMAVPCAENFENQPGGIYSRNCWQTGNETAGNIQPCVLDLSAYGKMLEIADGGYLVASDFVFAVPSLQMHLNYRSAAVGRSLYVGVITDPADIRSFVPIDTLTVYDVALVSSKTIHFEGYTGNGGNLCLYAPTGASFYVDNILIGENYYCPSVDTLWASDVTATAATASWNLDAYGSANSYLVEYGPAGFTMGTGTRMDVTAATVSLSGLTHSTVYDLYVTPICSLGDTMFASTPLRFQTNCEAMSLPYSMNFDLPYLPALKYTHQMPPCWTTELLDQDDEDAPQIAWNDKYSLYAQSGLNYLYFSDLAVTALPEMDASLNDVQLSFYAKASYSSCQLVVGVVDNLAPGFAASFVPVDTIDCASGVSDTVVFCDYTGTGQYIAFKNINTSGSSYSYISIDDVKVSLRPTCMPVTDVACNTATQNTMGISWATSTCNTPQSYQVEYGYHGYAQGNGRLLTTTDTTVTLTGLHPAMRYDVYVRSICAVGDTSAWTKAIFTTQSCESPDEMAMYDATATTTTTEYLPACSYYNYGYSQVIYDRATMIAAGFSAGSVVTGFAFYPTSTTGNTYYTNCSVLMKNSSKTEFASSTDFEAMEPSNLVYTGDLNWDTAGWKYVTFDAPFYWDGNSSVILAVDRNTGGYIRGATFQAVSGTANRGIYSYDDDNNVDPYTLSGVDGSYNSTTSTIPTYKLYSCADIHLNNVVANSSDEAMGRAVGGAYCMVGDTLTLTAVPATGHHFTQWTDGVTTSTRSVVVTGDATFTANFAIDVYTIVVESSDALLGTVTGSGSYDYGTTVTLAANAITGYHLEQWSDGNTDNPHTLTATEDATYVGTFAINSYMITATSNDTAMGTVTGGGSHDYNTTATLMANATTGYHFVQWNDGDTVNPRTLTVTADGSYEATFAINNYMLTVVSNDTAMGTVTGGGHYDHNATATLAATPKTEFRFVKWSDGITTNPRTLTVTEETTLTAVFATNKFILSAIAEDTLSGTVTGTGNYLIGTTVTMTATANPGYHFGHWHDGNTDNPRTVTVMGDTTYIVTFIPYVYQITATSSDTLLGTVNGGGSHDYNSTATLTAIGATGYHFTQWNDGDTTNPRLVTVKGDSTFTASFAISSFTLAAVANDTLRGTVTGSGSYVYKTTATLTATANEECFFTQWSDGDTANPHTVTVTGDTTYTAIFGINSYKVTATASDTALGSVAGSGNYDYNSTATLTASAVTGYHFAHWSDGDTVNPRAVTVKGDTTLSATFAIDRHTLTVLSADTVQGGTLGSGEYDYNSEVTFTAVAKLGYVFMQWNDGDTINPRTATVTSDTIFTASFSFDSYLLTVNSADTTLGTVTGGGSYDYRAMATLTAIPATECHLVQWSDGDTTNPRRVQVLGNADYTATFAVNSYMLSAVPSDTVMGTVTGGGSYDYGTTVTIEAVPLTGYHFVQWSDGIDTTLRTVTVSYDTAFTAVFAPNVYTIGVSSNNRMLGTVTGGGDYDYSTIVTLTATPATECHLVQWSDGDTATLRTVTVTGDADYTATFAVNSYVLSLTSADTAMGSVTGGGSYNYGTTAILAANALTGYHFVQWSDGITTNPRTLTMTRDTVISATFAATGYTIMVASSDIDMGSVTGGGRYYYHTTATLTATAATGHHFVQWNDGNTDNPRTLDVTGAATYIATFAVNSYVVSATAGDIAMGSVTGGGSYDYRAAAILTATANAGHRFVQWTDGIVSNPRTVTVVSDTTITATFVISRYVVTASSADANMGTVTGGGSYDYNAEATLTATANTGYHFVQWSDGSTANPRTVTVTEDDTYTATFVANSYAITATTANATMGSVSGSGSYSYNVTATLVATANMGYHFTQWSDGSSVNPRNVIVTDNATYTATFAANSYAITAITADATMGSVTGGGSYAYNATATLAATATTGYHFVSWNDGNTTNPRTVTVSGAATYTATFAANSYAITATAADATMGTVTGGGTYGYNLTANLTATAATGYHFVQWNDGNIANPRTVTVTGNATYTATFAADSYVVTAASANANMGTVTGGGSYGYNATATLTATASTGYHFVRWSDGSTINPRTVTVTGAATYIATFATTNYAITAISADASMGTVSGSGSYGYNTTVTLMATARTGYHFVQWSDGNTANPRTITVTGDASYTATFAATNYVVTATAADADMGTVTGGGSYAYGTTVALTATASTGYHFVNWSDGSTANPRTITVTGDATYTANFAAISYVITATSADATMGTVTGGGSYDYNATVTLTATANEGYSFVSWSDGNTDNPRTVTVTGDATYIATFQTVGIHDALALASLSLYPNPTEGQVTLSAETVIKVEVLDGVGRKVATFSNQRVLNLTALPAGIYTLRVTLPEGIAIRKVVKR